MSGALTGKRCLIVGGTSGIGLAAARRFRAEGANVVVAGLPGETADAARAALGEESILFADARVAPEVERLFADASVRLGGLDVLYHVAGSSGRKSGDGPLHECSNDGWQATIDANLTCVFLTNRAALRWFLNHQQPGVILNMSSVLAVSPAPRYFDTAAYTAAKGAIISLSRLAASRYAAEGIRVNVIAPALIDTPMAARAVHDPAIGEYLKAKQPLAHGPGSADDCAGAAVFLCSDAAAMVTGAVLPVDGGWCISEGNNA